jgi:hypothetical protein
MGRVVKFSLSLIFSCSLYLLISCGLLQSDDAILRPKFGGGYYASGQVESVKKDDVRTINWRYISIFNLKHGKFYKDKIIKELQPKIKSDKYITVTTFSFHEERSTITFFEAKEGFYSVSISRNPIMGGYVLLMKKWKSKEESFKMLKGKDGLIDILVAHDKLTSIDYYTKEQILDSFSDGFHTRSKSMLPCSL